MDIGELKKVLNLFQKFQVSEDVYLPLKHIRRPLKENIFEFIKFFFRQYKILNIFGYQYTFNYSNNCNTLILTKFH